MSNELNFNLKLPATPSSDLEYIEHRELQVIYNSIRLLAAQVAGGDMLEWSDYSLGSTISGWSSFVTKSIQLRYLNLNTLFVAFNISGVSNSVSASFTLPANSLLTNDFLAGLTGDNSVILTVPARGNVQSASNLVTLYKDPAAAAWTAAGTKSISGQFIINV